MKSTIQRALASFIFDYRGLTVKDTETLRRAVRAAGGHVSVHKNTLVKLALKETEQPAIDELLAGPSAFVFAGADAVAAAKAVKDFAKDNEKLVIKGGVMDGKACSAADVEAIASLPSREQLNSLSQDAKNIQCKCKQCSQTNDCPHH